MFQFGQTPGDRKIKKTVRRIKRDEKPVVNVATAEVMSGDPLKQETNKGNSGQCASDSVTVTENASFDNVKPSASFSSDKNTQYSLFRLTGNQASMRGTSGGIPFSFLTSGSTMVDSKNLESNRPKDSIIKKSSSENVQMHPGALNGTVECKLEGVNKSSDNTSISGSKVSEVIESDSTSGKSGKIYSFSGNISKSSDAFDKAAASGIVKQKSSVPLKSEIAESLGPSTMLKSEMAQTPRQKCYDQAVKHEDEPSFLFHSDAAENSLCTLSKGSDTCSVMTSQQTHQNTKTAKHFEVGQGMQKMEDSKSHISSMKGLGYTGKNVRGSKSVWYNNNTASAKINTKPKQMSCKKETKGERVDESFGKGTDGIFRWFGKGTEEGHPVGSPPFSNSAADLDTKPEHTSSENSSNTCEFCSNPSEYLCKMCCYQYCKTCLEKLHPGIGPYIQHKVVEIGAPNDFEHYPKCNRHGLVAGLWCSFCEQKRCLECANTSCSLHFKGKINDSDIEHAKEKLLRDYESATTKLRVVDRYKTEVQDKLENTRTMSLLRREQIRQEFISFHEMLADKEEKLLKALEKDTQARLKYFEDMLGSAVKTVEDEDAKLTTMVMELIQTEDTSKFVEEYARAEDQCQKVDGLVEDIYKKHCGYEPGFLPNYEPSFLLDSEPSFLLDYQMSVLEEKKELAEKLDQTVEGIPCLKFKQSTLVIGPVQPIRLHEYLKVPVVPPSTDVTYFVEVYTGQHRMYELETRCLQEVTLNTPACCILGPMKKYLIKVTPTYEWSPGKTTKWKGSMTHMLVVVVSFIWPTSEKLKAGNPVHSRVIARICRRRAIRK